MNNPDLSHLKGIFFDLDGTLIHTAPDFVAAVNRLRHEFDQPSLPASAIEPYVSEGASGLIRQCLILPDTTQATFQLARERLLDLYEATNHDDSTLFPGADQFLLALEELSIPWGIVTNKPERFATPLIEKLKLTDRLCCLLCPDHVAQKKPHPESLFLAASQANLAAEQCFYFGDHLRDIDAGKAAKMLTGSVSFGYYPADEDPLSWKADYHFESFQHIHQVFFGE